MKHTLCWSALYITPSELSFNQYHGGVTGKILENHVRENIGWILFKTRNFYIFLDI